MTSNITQCKRAQKIFVINITAVGKGKIGIKCFIRMLLVMWPMAGDLQSLILMDQSDGE